MCSSGIIFGELGGIMRTFFNKYIRSHYEDKNSQHRAQVKMRLLVTSIVSSLVLSLLVVAINIQTMHQQHMELNDATVWISSHQKHKIARFDALAQEANATVAATQSHFDIIQHDSYTILSEENMHFSTISASDVVQEQTVHASHPTQVEIGGSTAAFFNTVNGDVHVCNIEKFSSCSLNREKALLTLKPGGAISVTANGSVWAANTNGDISVMHDHERTFQLKTHLDNVTAIDGFTVIEDVPVIALGSRIIWPQGNIDTGLQGDTFSLQHTPVDHLYQQHWVVLAGNGNAASVDLQTGDVFVLRSAGTGRAAQPVSVKGCVYIAFSQQSRNMTMTCSAQDAEHAAWHSLNNVHNASNLVLRVNHGHVILNDVHNGAVWDSLNSPDAVEIQWDRFEEHNVNTDALDTNTSHNTIPAMQQCKQQTDEIQAVDDTFTVRAGSRRILDVLRNDQQNACSIASIGAVHTISHSQITPIVVYNGGFIQIDTTDVQGNFSFSYTINDGRNKESNARVSVTVLESESNQPPSQTLAPMHIDIEQSATYQTQALVTFSDPEEDTLILVAAQAVNAETARISVRPDGQLTFFAASLDIGTIEILLTVSDGQDTCTGSIFFNIHKPHTLPAQVDPIRFSVQPNIPSRIDITSYLHTTSFEPVILTSVDAPEQVHIAIQSHTMTMQVLSQDPGTYYIPFVVKQHAQETTGLLRLTVHTFQTEDTTPVAVDDTALLDTQNTAIVEPLSNDIDPTGGVLALSDATVLNSDGISTAIIDYHRLYIALQNKPSTPIIVQYTATNAAQNVQGIITLYPALDDANTNALFAHDITLHVCVQHTVSADIREYITAADINDIKLNPEITYNTNFLGLVFTDGTQIRYKAPNKEGTFQAAYTVQDSFSHTASATIRFVVHEKDSDTKQAPYAQNLTAQVAAGKQVRIPIPLHNIDQDGESGLALTMGTQLPKHGRITQVGTASITYEAYSDFAGTDEFTYAVEDWIGQRSQATIRVGVFTGNNNQPLLARNDKIRVRPATDATVAVLSNDVFDANDEVTLLPTLESQGIENPLVRNRMVTFTAPQQPGVYYITYRIASQYGKQSTAIITVVVDLKAPIQLPIAFDYHIPAQEIIDKSSVDIDVSKYFENPAGNRSALRISLPHEELTYASLLGDETSTRIRVAVQEQSYTLAYRIQNIEHNVFSYGFVHIPASGSFEPTLRPNAPEIRVQSGKTIEISIADYVYVGSGKTAYISDLQPVSATKAANTDFILDNQTLRFVAQNDYAGPASISFLATDNNTCDEKEANPTKNRSRSTDCTIHSSVITLPITIIAAKLVPPTLPAITVDVTAGEDATAVNLRLYTKVGSTVISDTDAYKYSGGLETHSIKATVSRDGTAHIQAYAHAIVGTDIRIPVNIQYASGQVHEQIIAHIIASPRPLSIIPDQHIRMHAGEQKQFNVFAQAFNPFADKPLSLINCSSSQPQIHLTCQNDGTIAIDVSHDIGSISATIQLTTRDATDSDLREVHSLMHIAVIDKPSAPLLSPVSGKAQDKAVTLQWQAAKENGSPITEHEVRWDSGSQRCGNTTSCLIEGLTNGKSYVFSVRAKNEVGWSVWSNSTEAMPDTTPPAPIDFQVSAGKNTVTATWNMPPYLASPVQYFMATLQGSDGTQSVQTVERNQVAFTLPNEQLSDTTAYTVRVSAVNNAGESPASESAPVIPWGSPDPLQLALSMSNSNTMILRIATGNMRNTSCKSLSIQGKGVPTQKIDCATKTIAIALNADMYFTRQTYTVAMELNHGELLQANITSDEIVREILPVTDLAVVMTYRHTNPNNPYATCNATWQSQGEYDGFLVTVQGETHTTRNPSYTYTVQGGWVSCGEVRVQQYLSDYSHTSPSQHVIGHDKLEIPARIETSQLSNLVSWIDHNTISYKKPIVETWDRPATIEIVIPGLGYTIRDFSLKNEESFTIKIPEHLHPTDFFVRVTGSDPALYAIEQGKIMGNRPALTTVHRYQAKQYALLS